MARAAASRLTHARVLKIAVPIVLSNATVPLLGAVDTAVVGQIGLAAPIGAVGIGAVILSSMFWIFGFLRMSTSGLAAQAKGAGDEGELRAVLLRALIVAFAVGLAVIALQTSLFALAFHLSPASTEVEAMARDYLSIRIWAAPASVEQFACPVVGPVDGHHLTIDASRSPGHLWVTNDPHTLNLVRLDPPGDRTPTQADHSLTLTACPTPTVERHAG